VRGCRFEGSGFDRAVLAKATVGQSLFNPASFSSADLTRICVLDSELSGQALFSRSSLAGAQFFQTSFGGAVFEDSDLTLAVIRDCSFKSLALLRSKAVQLQAGNLALRGLKAEESDLSLAFFGGSDLSAARLSGLEMSGAFFGQAVLAEADLSGSKAAKAIFDDADLSHADLRDLMAPYASLCRANLAGARLSGADLSGADIHRAKGLDLGGSGAKADGARPTDELLARAEDFTPWTAKE
jgi:uncharacterized protein YjbI with pentapeptide repeats